MVVTSATDSYSGMASFMFTSQLSSRPAFSRLNRSICPLHAAIHEHDHILEDHSCVLIITQAGEAGRWDVPPQTKAEQFLPRPGDLFRAVFVAALVPTFDGEWDGWRSLFDSGHVGLEAGEGLRAAECEEEAGTAERDFQHVDEVG